MTVSIKKTLSNGSFLLIMDITWRWVQYIPSLNNNIDRTNIPMEIFLITHKTINKNIDIKIIGINFNSAGPISKNESNKKKKNSYEQKMLKKIKNKILLFLINWNGHPITLNTAITSDPVRKSIQQQHKLVKDMLLVHLL